MASLRRMATAYVGATVSTLGPAGVGSVLANAWFGWSLNALEVMGILWLVVVGGPSMGWAATNLSKMLGIRPLPSLGVRSWREIPIGAGRSVSYGDVVRSVFGAQKWSETTLEIPEEWAFLSGSFVFPEREVKPMLYLAWSRQRCGKGAFARRYWLSRPPFHGDRDMYDCWCDVCEAADLLRNRTDRHSGRLILSPVLALSALRHSMRRVRIN